jgi:hypothetical protein
MSDAYVPPWAELATPAPDGVPDDGPAVLDQIRADLQMDDEWIVRTPRSLTWWGAPIPIRFTVARPRQVQGDPTIKLTIAATVLVDVPSDTPTVLAVLNDVNRTASTGALVWLQDERRVDIFLTHYAHPGVEPITHVMSALALLVYGEGVGRARFLAEKLGGTPNIVAHPVSGVRDDHDEMMTFTETQVLPVGRRPNQWGEGELVHLAGYITDNGIGISTGDADGLTVEFPLARDEREIYLRLRSHVAYAGEFGEDPIAPFFSTPTGLGQLLCVEHPLYGNGLLSLLRFQIRTRGDGLAFAIDFNLGEYRSRTGFPAIGAWCADENDGLVQNGFVPNYYHRDWVALNLALWAGTRTRWAFEAMAPDLLAEPNAGGSP